MPLHGMKDLILEQEEIYETLAKVHDAHAGAHRKTVQLYKDAAVEAINKVCLTPCLCTVPPTP